MAEWEDEIEPSKNNRHYDRQNGNHDDEFKQRRARLRWTECSSRDFHVHIVMPMSMCSYQNCELSIRVRRVVGLATNIPSLDTACAISRHDTVSRLMQLTAPPGPLELT